MARLEALRRLPAVSEALDFGCLFCAERRRAVRLPCGHVSTCLECAAALRRAGKPCMQCGAPAAACEPGVFWRTYSPERERERERERDARTHARARTRVSRSRPHS